MATRRTQPYRKGRARTPGAALAAMLRGEPLLRPHPMAAKRELKKRSRLKRPSVRR